MALAGSGRNVLKVKVTENKMGAERTSYVLVNANGATGKIAVTQSAADVTLDVVPNAIYLPQQVARRRLTLPLTQLSMT